ncbi:MAG TPA: GYF domain-containing protein [Thermoguttaceae bacterium]|nr:GYF domain-containing protein [Thermoguttaceae bacterium]
MSTAKAVWYLPGEGSQTLGPFTSTQIVQSLQTDRISGKTLCWREGMPQWLPLAQVEPFASTIRPTQTPSAQPVTQAQPAKPRRRSRLLGRLCAVVCLIALGAGTYYYVPGLLAVRRARGMIAEGDYSEAARLMRPREDDFFHGREAGYLYALAEIREYAGEDEVSETRALRRAQRRLEDVLETDAKSRPRAASDFAGILADVPHDAADLMPRSLAIAELLGELELVDARVLAEELAGKLKEYCRSKRPEPHDPDAARGAIFTWSRELAGEPVIKFVRQILDWDPELGGEVVAAVLLPEQDADRNELQLRLNLVAAWIQQEPSLKEALSAGLLKSADSYVKAGKYDLADDLLTMSAIRNAELQNAVSRKRLECAKGRLESEDLAGVVETLNRVVRETPELLDEAGEVYVQLVQKHADELDRLPRVDPALTKYADGLQKSNQFNVHLSAAQAAMKDGQFAAGIAEFKLALLLRPEDKKAARGLQTAQCSQYLHDGRTALEAHDLDKAAGLFDLARRSALEMRFLSEGPEAEDLLAGVSSAYKTAGDKAIGSGDFTGAIEFCETGLEIRKNDPELGKLKEQAIGKIVEQCKIDGRDAVTRGEYERAIEAFDKILEVRPDDPEAPSLKRQAIEKAVQDRIAAGQKAMAAEDFERAVEAFEKALELDALNAQAKQLRESALAKRDDRLIQTHLEAARELTDAQRPYRYREALREVQQSLGIRPDHAQAMALLEEIVAVHGAVNCYR